MSKFNQKIMEKTYAFACETQRCCKTYIYSSLVYKNRIIVSKPNERKSHPFQKRFAKNSDCIYLHAETNCVITALRNGFDPNALKYCQLYIARASKLDCKTFSMALVTPCAGCAALINEFKIKTVFHTTATGFACL